MSNLQGNDGAPRGQGGLSYRASGVDIDAGNEAVRRIKALVGATRRPEQIGDLGGFAGLMGLPRGLQEPVLVACTDGVGTKLLVAIAMDRHDTVGIDLVAMNVNDLLVTGGEALFLLDYVACGRLEPGKIEAIVAGIAEGCKQAGCSLLGGETAELPGMYADGHYDLAAFAVGVVDRARLLGPQRVRAGDVALALASSGLHSNGYSLARRALLDPAHAGLALDAPLPGGVGETVGDALLTPTRIYTRAFAAALRENPQRALADDLAIAFDLTGSRAPAIFQAIAAQGVGAEEMLRTFNCGIGLVVYCDPTRAGEVQRALEDAGERVRPIGVVVPRGGADAPQVRIHGADDLFHRAR